MVVHGCQQHILPVRHADRQWQQVDLLKVFQRVDGRAPHAVVPVAGELLQRRALVVCIACRVLLLFDLFLHVFCF